MDETTLRSTWPDWQDNRAYDYTEHLTRLGWAWEFLRRNPDFQRDLATVLSLAERSVTGSGIVLTRLPTSAGLLLRWGLLFCWLNG